MKLNPNNQIKVLAVIPCRGGSKRIPRKNIVDFLGRPLIAYTIEAAHQSKLIDATIVSTDDEEIATVSKELGADVPFIRPAHLATDTSNDLDYLQHALDWVEKERGWKPEIILFVPPTSPSRTSVDLDNAIQLLLDSKADSVRTVVYPHHFTPFKMWIDDEKGGGVIQPLFPQGLKGLRNQDLPKYYMPVAIAYATRTEFIKQGRLWGDKVVKLEIPLERFTDIDTPEDLEHTKEVVTKFLKK